MKRKVKGKRKGEEIGNSARFVWKFIGFIGNRLEWKTEWKTEERKERTEGENGRRERKERTEGENGRRERKERTERVVVTDMTRCNVSGYVKGS